MQHRVYATGQVCHDYLLAFSVLIAAKYDRIIIYQVIGNCNTNEKIFLSL